MNDEAFMDGYASCPCSIYSNPYPEKTTEFRRWVDGWVHGIIAERATMRIVLKVTDVSELVAAGKYVDSICLLCGTHAPPEQAVRNCCQSGLAEDMQRDSFQPTGDRNE